MASNAWSRWRGVVIVLTSVAVSAMVVMVAAALSSSPAPSSSAVSLGRSTLRRVVVPPGSTRTQLPTTGPLSGPFDAPATPNLVDVAKAWIVPLSMDAAVQFLAQHPPAGLSASGCCGETESRGTVVARWLTYSLPTNDPLIQSASLGIAVAPLSASASTVRADALLVWVPARTAESLIPPRDRFATVMVSLFTTPPSSSETVALSDPAAVANLRALLNALRVAAPRTQSCPTGGTQYRLAFATAKTAAPGYVASVGTCGYVSLSRDGRDLPPMRTDPPLLQAVDSLFPGTVRGQFLAVGGPPGALPQPEAGTIEVHAGDVNGPVVVTGRSGPDGLFRIEVSPGGPYFLTGHAPQYHVNGLEGLCRGTEPFNVQAGQTVLEPVHCERF